MHKSEKEAGKGSREWVSADAERGLSIAGERLSPPHLCWMVLAKLLLKTRASTVDADAR